VEFVDVNWVDIGTKRSLASSIESITGITHLWDYRKASVAQKMSWASKRETTRLEDQAYCFMGLFDVNMLLLYSEGNKAFLRLQLEILNTTDDDSVLAWQGVNYGGLLAPSPTHFQSTGDIVGYTFDKSRPPFTMTAKGLSLELVFVKLGHSNALDAAPQFVYAPLNCKRVSQNPTPSPKTVVVLLLYDGSGIWKRSPILHSVVQPKEDIAGNSLLRIHIYVLQGYDEVLTNVWPDVLLEHHSLINHRYLLCDKSSSETHCWVENSCQRLVLRKAERVAFDSDDRCFDALIFSKYRFESLMITVTCFSHRNWIDVVVGKESDLFAKADVLPSDDIRIVGRDMVSCKPEDGSSVNVTLRKGWRSGKVLFTVNIQVSHEGEMPWRDRSGVSD
jgi:hypothetical protein